MVLSLLALMPSGEGRNAYLPPDRHVSVCIAANAALIFERRPSVPF